MARNLPASLSDDFIYRKTGNVGILSIDISIEDLVLIRVHGLIIFIPSHGLQGLTL